MRRSLTKLGQAHYESLPLALLRKGRLMPLEFPPDLNEDPERGVTIRLRESMWTRLDAISKKIKKPRNKVLAHLLNWALDEYENAMRQKGAVDAAEAALTKRMSKK